MVVLIFLGVDSFFIKITLWTYLYLFYPVDKILSCLLRQALYRLTTPLQASHVLINLQGQQCYSSSFLILKLMFFLFLSLFVVVLFGSQIILIIFQRTSFFSHYFSSSNFIDFYFLLFP